MSHSKQTANYGLPLFEPKDRPAWLTDFNGAMTAVDATVKGLEESIQAGGLPLTGGTMQGSINMGDHAITNVQEVELQSSGDGLYIGSVVQPNGTAGARLTGVAGGAAAFVKPDSQSIYVPVSVGSPSQDKHAATKEYVDTAIGNIPSSGITQEQADARYLQLSGGTMTGDLKVQESPASDASAVSKSYAQSLFATAVSKANLADQAASSAQNTASNALGVAYDALDAADAALPKAGGTMTGDLILNGAPTVDNQAATKAYVDGKAGGMQLVGTDTRSFSGITAADYNVTAEISGSKPFMVEIIVRAGSAITVGGGSAQSCGLRVFDGDTLIFPSMNGVVTLTTDVAGYKTFSPIETNIAQNFTETHYFSAVSRNSAAQSIVAITNYVNIKFVINYLTSLTGTITTNVYQ